MFTISKAHMLSTLLTLGILGYVCAPATAAVRIEGQVQAGGGPLANSTVTLWAASTADPRQLAQTKTSSDGRFQIDSQETIGADAILYLIAKGGEAAINKGDARSFIHRNNQPLLSPSQVVETMYWHEIPDEGYQLTLGPWRL